MFLFSAWRPSWLEVGITGHIWKGAIQGPFHQSLVAIGPVVSEEKIKMWNVDGRTTDDRRRTKSDDNSSHGLKARLMPLSAIFQLYHGDQFYLWKKPEYPERTTDNGQATSKLYHLRLWVECTLFCNLHSRARTSIAGNVDPRPVTHGDLTWPRPTAEVRSRQPESQIKGPHFILLTLQRVINCFIITLFS
jgi:hypothetical protein